MKLLLFTFCFLFSVATLIAQLKFKTIVPLTYNDCGTYVDGKIIATKKVKNENRSDIIDAFTGKMLLKNIELITYFNNGTITFNDAKNEIGFIRGNNPPFYTKFTKGSLRIDAKPDDFVAITNTENNKVSFLDTLGNEIPLPTNFDKNKYNLAFYLGYQMWAITAASEDKSFEINAPNSGLLGSKGVIIEPAANQIIDAFINGVASITLPDGSYKFLKIDGSFLSQPTLSSLQKSDFQNYGNKITPYIKDEKMGLIFNGGNYITDATYDDAPFICNQRKFYITKNKKYGVLDEAGKELVPFKFESFKDACEAETKMYQKRINNLYGFTNSDGKMVIKPIYNNAFPFNNNHAMVVNVKNKMGAINKKGETVIPFEYDKFFYGNIPNVFVAVKNGKYGILKIIE
jgi:hypothetical protein